MTMEWEPVLENCFSLVSEPANEDHESTNIADRSRPIRDLQEMWKNSGRKDTAAPGKKDAASIVKTNQEDSKLGDIWMYFKQEIIPKNSLSSLDIVNVCNNLSLQRVSLTLSVKASISHSWLLLMVDRLIQNDVLKSWLVLKAEQNQFESQPYCVLEIHHCHDYQSLYKKFVENTCLPLPFVHKEVGHSYYYLRLGTKVEEHIDKINHRVFYEPVEGICLVSCDQGIYLKSHYKKRMNNITIYMKEPLQEYIKDKEYAVLKLIRFEHMLFGFLQAWIRKVAHVLVITVNDMAKKLVLRRASKYKMSLIKNHPGKGQYIYTLCQMEDNYFYIMYSTEMVEELEQCKFGFEVGNFESSYVSVVPLIQYYRQFLFLHTTDYNKTILKEAVEYFDKNPFNVAFEDSNSKSVETSIAPVQNSKSVDTYITPVPSPKSVDTYNAPVRSPKYVDTYNAPVPSPKYVDTYSAPVLSSKSVDTSNAPLPLSTIEPTRQFIKILPSTEKPSKLKISSSVLKNIVTQHFTIAQDSPKHPVQIIQSSHETGDQFGKEPVHVAQSTLPPMPMLQCAQPSMQMLQSVQPSMPMLQSVQPPMQMLQSVQPSMQMLQSVQPSMQMLQSVQPPMQMLQSTHQPFKIVQQQPMQMLLPNHQTMQIIPSTESLRLFRPLHLRPQDGVSSSKLSPVQMNQNEAPVGMVNSLQVGASNQPMGYVEIRMSKQGIQEVFLNQLVQTGMNLSTCQSNPPTFEPLPLSVPPSSIEVQDKGVSKLESLLTCHSESDKPVNSSTNQMPKKPFLKTRTVEEINSMLKEGLLEDNCTQPKEVTDNSELLESKDLLPFLRCALDNCYKHSKQVEAVSWNKSNNYHVILHSFNTAVSMATKTGSFDEFLGDIYKKLLKSFKPEMCKWVMEKCIFETLRKKYGGDNSLQLSSDLQANKQPASQNNSTPVKKVFVHLQKLEQILTSKERKTLSEKGCITVKNPERFDVRRTTRSTKLQARPVVNTEHEDSTSVKFESTLDIEDITLNLDEKNKVISGLIIQSLTKALTEKNSGPVRKTESSDLKNVEVTTEKLPLQLTLGTSDQLVANSVMGLMPMPINTLPLLSTQQPVAIVAPSLTLAPGDTGQPQLVYLPANVAPSIQVDEITSRHDDESTTPHNQVQPGTSKTENQDPGASDETLVNLTDSDDEDIKVLSMKSLPNKKESLQCVFCSVGFRSGRRLREHVSRMHSSDITYRCSKCDKCFVKPHYLELHVKLKHHKNKQCTYCNVTLPNLKSLELHLQSTAHLKNKERRGVQKPC